MAKGAQTFVVIGAGKTAMDTCVWLLSNGVSASAMRWVKPREGWWLNRRYHQPHTLLLGSDEEKNRVCRPIRYWSQPADYLTAYMALLTSGRARAAHPALAEWANGSRLNALGRLEEHRDDPRVVRTRAVLKEFGASAVENVQNLLAAQRN